MSTEHLTTVLSAWIQSEDSDVPLIQRVDAAINDSKALIHKRLEVLSEKDALSGLDVAVEQVAAQLALSNELLAAGTKQLNRIEEDVLPLLSLPLAELSQQLCSVEQFYSICRHVDNVKKFHIVVDSMLDAEKNQKFNLAVEKLNYAQDLVQTLELSVDEPTTSFHADILEITNVASKDLMTHRLNLCDSAAHFWKSNVAVKTNSNSVGEITFNQVSILLEQSELEKLLYALNELGEIDKLLSKFSSDLKNLFIRPVLDRNVVIIEVNPRELVTESYSSDGNYDQVENLIVFFDFFRNALSELPVMMNVIKDIASEASILVVDSLSRDVKPGGDQKVLQRIAIFEDYLAENDLVAKVGSKQTNAQEGISARLVTKLCFHYLLEARQIIRGDLADSEELLSSSENAANGENKLRVSKVSVKLISFIEQMMKEARTSAEDYQSGLFVAVRDAVKLFVEMCPLVHRELIFELPQTCALFHNSCIHIGKEMDKFSECQSLLQPVIVELYNLADSVLAYQIRAQSGIIQDFFQDPHVLQCLIDNSEENANSLKPFDLAVERSFFQLGLLKKSWSPVLPVEIFNASMGSLADELMGQIIGSVTVLEDISAGSAKRLAAIMDGTSLECLDLFEEPMEGLPSLAPKSFAFRELQFVLTASLREIVDRWSDGEGPLASAFSSGEVKRLVRALFQNSDRRASALALIK